MFDFIWQPQSLVYIAGGAYVLGLIIINQIVLRVLILAGTGIYILYYATVAETPLWDAIYISVMIGLANVFGMGSLLVRKSKLALPRAHIDIYPLLETLPPGDFRALMKRGSRYKTDDKRVLTQQDTKGTSLYFIVSGQTHVDKSGNLFELPEGLFVGEVAFLTGIPSSATVWVEPNTEVVEWSFQDLYHLSERNSRFKLALEAALSLDMALKISKAVAPPQQAAPAAIRGVL